MYLLSNSENHSLKNLGLPLTGKKADTLSYSLKHCEVIQMNTFYLTQSCLPQNTDTWGEARVSDRNNANSITDFETEYFLVRAGQYTRAEWGTAHPPLMTQSLSSVY